MSLTVGGITTQTQVTKLEPSQQRAAAEMLGRAFFDDPLSVYLLPDEAKRARLLPWMYERIVRYGLRYDGEVLATHGAVDGVAVWLPPGLSHTPALRLVRVGLALTPIKFGLGAVGRFMAANHVERLRMQLAPEPHWYLWLIGVEPAQQGRGTGSALIAPMIERADRDRLPCYLETHKERNLTFYRKHGFEVVHAADMPHGGPPFWCLKRAARR